MNKEQMSRMHDDPGFIAALDQSGGSTPKALAQYGIPKDRYASDEEMFDLVHAMRSRILTSPSFTGDRIIGVILFENTMMRSVEGLPTPDYLWEKKRIVPFLKVDEGLAEKSCGAQLMKPMKKLAGLLDSAVKKRVFGTKMRSVIYEANLEGVAAVVEQQFEYARQIFDAGLVPIIEPEVDIRSPDKREAEVMLKREVIKNLAVAREGFRTMFKFSIPDEDNFYRDVIADPHVVRVVALSGGYSQREADELLARNHGLIASFSRALLEGLTAGQNAEEFDRRLGASVQAIYNASIM